MWGVSSVEIFLQVNFAAPVSNSRDDVDYLNPVKEHSGACTRSAAPGIAPDAEGGGSEEGLNVCAGEMLNPKAQ